MSRDYVVAVEGLTSLRDIEQLDDKILTRARQAINRTLDRTRTSSDREMRQQVAFPARYLSTRLTVKRRPSGSSLAGVISGRDRPTSLARFASSRNVAASRKRGSVDVTVAPGQTRNMRGAFLMQLRNGNIGLALRLKDGETIRGKRKVVKVGKGLYLLYGPSVDQVFQGVSEDQVPGAAAFLEAEFLRLLGL